MPPTPSGAIDRRGFVRSPGRWASGFQYLARPRQRLAIYGVCALLLYSIALALMAAKVRFTNATFDFAIGDGKSYYLYVASAIVDGDLDFRNQMVEHWGYQLHDRDLRMKTPRGYVYNKYPIGVSLTLLPSFLLAHAASFTVHSLTSSGRFAPDGYSVLYQLLNLGWVLALSWATMALLDRLMERHFQLEGRAILAAVLLVWLASHYAYYCVRFPLMSHIISAFWVTGIVALVAAAVAAARQQRIVWWHWPLLSFSLGMAVICRPSNLFILPFPGYLLVVLFRQHLAGRVLRYAPLMLLGLAPLALQIVVWHRFFGEVLPFTYEPGERFLWARPSLWGTLFSPVSGLLYWAPVWTMGLLGIVIHIKRYGWRRDWLPTCYIIALLILWYTNSAWWAWQFGRYPGRAFVEASGLFVIGLALLFQQTIESPRRQQAVMLTIVAAAVICSYLLMVGYDLRLLPSV